MRRVALIVLSLLFIACLEESASYSPELDDRAMASITRTWELTTGPGALMLCEDLVASAAGAADSAENDCQVENVVRGGGRGDRHDESRGGGCGGCPFANMAYVNGTVSGMGLAAPVEVSGSVDVGQPNDPYGYPYQLVLFSRDSATPFTLRGELEADGSLELTMETGDPGAPPTSTVSAVLTPGIAASCPM